MVNHIESRSYDTQNENNEISALGYVSLAIMGNMVAVIAAVLVVI